MALFESIPQTWHHKLFLTALFAWSHWAEQMWSWKRTCRSSIHLHDNDALPEHVYINASTLYSIREEEKKNLQNVHNMNLLEKRLNKCICKFDKIMHVWISVAAANREFAVTNAHVRMPLYSYIVEMIVVSCRGNWLLISIDRMCICNYSNSKNLLVVTAVFGDAMYLNDEWLKFGCGNCATFPSISAIIPNYMSVVVEEFRLFLWYSCLNSHTEHCIEENIPIQRWHKCVAVDGDHLHE